MAYKIAIIVGSLRKDSLNRKVGAVDLRASQRQSRLLDVEIGDLPLYNQDLDADPPEQWTRFRQQVAAADGVLFVSPEYNRGIPGALKNAIDVGSRPYGQSVFDKKPAAIVTASPGAIGGFGSNHQIRQACGVPQHADDAAARGLSRPRQRRQLRRRAAASRTGRSRTWSRCSPRFRRLGRDDLDRALLAEDSAHAAKAREKAPAY